MSQHQEPPVNRIQQVIRDLRQRREQARTFQDPSAPSWRDDMQIAGRQIAGIVRQSLKKEEEPQPVHPVYATPEQATHLYQTLSSAFGFNQKDIESNRQGMLTGKQRFLLHGKILKHFIGYLVGLIIGFFIASVGVNNIIHANLNDIVATLISLVVGSLFCLFFIQRLFIAIPQRCGELWSARSVYSIEGTLTVFSVDGGEDSPDSYYCKMNDKKFKIDYKRYAAFSNGLIYRVYYLPRMNTIVSVEPLVHLTQRSWY